MKAISKNLRLKMYGQCFNVLGSKMVFAELHGYFHTDCPRKIIQHQPQQFLSNEAYNQEPHFLVSLLPKRFPHSIAVYGAVGVTLLSVLCIGVVGAFSRGSRSCRK